MRVEAFTARIRHAALTLGWAVVTPHATAHDAGDLPIPESAGWQVGTALAVSHARSTAPWPATRLPGILGAGNAPVDRRGDALEHATVSGGIRVSPHWSAAVVLGWHDNDPYHVEAAWLQGQTWWRTQDGLEIGVGRRHLPLGRVLEGGGHFDRMGSMPLAKRGVLDGDWIDDGLNLRWLRSHTGPWAWLQTLDVGVWTGRSFPGGEGGRWAPAVHANAAWGDLVLDLSLASLRPHPRAARVQSDTSGHSHDTPSCGGSLLGVFCFEGRTHVATGSLSWRLPGPARAWHIEGAGILRQDKGRLYSQSGDTTYSGTTGGVWVDLIWHAHEQVTVSTRIEQVRAVQSITGRSARVVATEAGLTGSTRLQRQSLAASWQPLGPSLKLSLEAGRDIQGAQQDDFQALRVTWTPAPLAGDL